MAPTDEELCDMYLAAAKDAGELFSQSMSPGLRAVYEAGQADATAAERERVSAILDVIQNSLDSNGSYCECAGYQRVEWLEDQLDSIREDS